MVVLIVLIVIVVGLIVAGVTIYNGVIRSDNQVENAWSQIDVQLKRRLNLVPNLVEIVRGYAAHERATLERVVLARNASIEASDTPGEQAAADNALTGALRQLFALGEAYPNLKADRNFLELQEQVTATEDRVGYARQFYNDSVLSYNNKIESIPSVFAARMLNYSEREYFKADEEARTVPSIRF